MAVPAPPPKRGIPWLRSSYWKEQIQLRDAHDDAHEIVWILGNWIFPLEALFAMEMAQLRTFAIPSISRVLHATGEYEHRGVKRLDDTRAIMVEIVQSQPDSREQQEMIHHLNRIHALYNIPNEDMLYVLTTFMFEPGTFIDAFGFRKLTTKEWDACFYAYKNIGEKMGIHNIPPTRTQLWQWRWDYEKRKQAYSPENRAVAEGFLAAAKDMLPPPLRPISRELALASVNDKCVLRALGMPEPAGWAKFAVKSALRAFRHSSTYINPFEIKGLSERPFIFDYYPTYPMGYVRLQLGPTRVLKVLQRRAEHGLD